MALLGQEYVVSEFQPTSFDPIPAGWYTARITETKLKKTKAGNGEYLEMKFDIVGPSYEGRCVWGRFNLKNPNPKAEQIGQQQFFDCARSIGLDRVTDSDEFLGGALQIKVAVKPADGQYDESNDVKGFKPLEGGATMLKQEPKAAMNVPAQAPATAPVVKNGNAPWLKNK